MHSSTLEKWMTSNVWDVSGPAIWIPTFRESNFLKNVTEIMFFKTFGPHYWVTWKRLANDGHGQSLHNCGLKKTNRWWTWTSSGSLQIEKTSIIDLDNFRLSTDTPQIHRLTIQIMDIAYKSCIVVAVFVYVFVFLFVVFCFVLSLSIVVLYE